MGAALLGFAMVLMGAGAPPDLKSEPVNITYLVQYVDAQGLDWREAALADLKPISRQHGATVWIASAGAMTRIYRAMQANTGTNVVQAPKVVGRSGDPVHLHSRSDVSLATKVSFTGPSPRVESEKLRQGWMTTMAGRRLDQGILVRMVAENTAILAVHHVAAQSGAAHPTGAATVRSGVVRVPGKFTMIDGDDEAATTEDEEKPACCAKDGAIAASATLTAEAAVVKIDVPEVDTQEVAGEWLIGPEEGLVVSFGVHTVADEHGKAIVRERLIVLRAHQTTPEEGSNKVAGAPVFPNPLPYPAGVAHPGKAWIRAVPAPTSPPLVRLAPVPEMPPPPTHPIGNRESFPPVPIGVSVPALPALPAAMIPPPAPIGGSEITIPIPPRSNIRPAPLPAPSAPSRTLPQGVDALGNPSVLPALPEDDEPDADASETSEPMPSPQTKKPKPPTPASDSATRRTGFIPSPISLAAPLIASLTSPTRFQFLIPLKPISLRLPFNQRLEFEIVGRVVDAPVLSAAAD